MDRTVPRTGTEEIALYIRTYYSLLRSSNAVQLDALDDYSRHKSIPDKERVAEELFRKALDYAPDHRAFLGLSLLLQKRCKWNASIQLLKEGLEWFPSSEHIHLALGVNYMNRREYDEAISWFSKFSHSKKARYYIAICEEEKRHQEMREGSDKKSVLGKA